MEELPLSTLWLNLIVISGTWGSSFVPVRLITESMHPFAFAASRGFIAMSALGTAEGVHHKASPPRLRGRHAAVARKPHAEERA
jgi:hypothetical protein